MITSHLPTRLQDACNLAHTTPPLNLNKIVTPVHPLRRIDVCVGGSGVSHCLARSAAQTARSMLSAHPRPCTTYCGQGFGRGGEGQHKNTHMRTTREGGDPAGEDGRWVVLGGSDDLPMLEARAWVWVIHATTLNTMQQLCRFWVLPPLPWTSTRHWKVWASGWWGGWGEPMIVYPDS